MTFFPSAPRYPVKSLLMALGLCIVVLSGCSSDEPTNDAAPNNGEQLDVGPDVIDGSTGGPTTLDPTSPSTDTTADAVEPSVLEETKFSRVYVASNGRDNRTGESAQQAVASLKKALTLLAPGGTIVFQPGTYEPLEIDGVNGAAGSPIRLEAAGAVEFRDRDYKSGAGILVRNSRHVEVVGMSTRRSLWGIYVDNAHHITLRSNNVGDVGQEGIRVKGGSSNIRIDSNVVADTGRRTDKGEANGEGIYIGTGTPGGVDHVKNIVVINNQIRRVTDEAIDVKRPSTNVDIIGNTISDVVTQTSGAIVVHLNGDQGGDPKINIERNTIRNVTRSSSYRDGNCIVAQVTVRIINNVLHNCQHRGIFLRGSAGTATVQHNTLINTGDLGALVNEGRGMRVVSENNLGTDGDTNRKPSNDVYANPGNGNYRLRDDAAADLRNAPNKGVRNDRLGAGRPSSGPVTFGAIEATGSAPPAPTTTAPATQPTPPTTEAAAPAPTNPPQASPPTTQRLAAPVRTTTTRVLSPATTRPRTPVTTVRRPTDDVASGPVGPARAPTIAVQGTPSVTVPARQVGTPSDANPSVPGRDPSITPVLEQVSCQQTFMCSWAPFL